MNDCLSDMNIERYENSLNKILDIVLKNIKVETNFYNKSNRVTINFEKKFSLIWYYFLEMVIDISIVWKKYHTSLECWYIFGTCVLNQTYNTSNYSFEKNDEIVKLTQNKFKLARQRSSETLSTQTNFRLNCQFLSISISKFQFSQFEIIFGQNF